MRKATPAKSDPAPAAKSAKTGKAAKPASPARPAGGGKPTKPAAPPAKTAAKPAVKPPATKQPVKPAPVKSAQKNGGVPAAKSRPAAKPPATPKPAPRPAPVARQQPTRDEAAALRAFERAHREFARGRFAEARNLFRALIDEHGGVAEVTARARTYLSIAEARLRTESALPRDAEALYDRGVIELNRGDYVAAQELFERALKRDEGAADTHYALAATRARLGNIESALLSLQRALELRPGLRVRAQYDPDFAALRNEPEYERLVFPSRV